MPKGTGLHCYAHDHITTLSLRKTKIVFWPLACAWASNSPATSCAHAFFVSEVLVAPQPISIHVLTSWPVVAFSSIPALMRHFLARRLLFWIIWNRYAETRNWKWAPGWWISSKKMHTKISGKSVIQKSFCVLYDQRRAPSMWSAAPASSVLGTFLSPMAECTTCQLEASHQQRKSDKKYAEDFPLIFMGCEMPSSQHLDVIQAEMLFTNFFVVHSIALSAANHDICAGAHFRKSELRRAIYKRYTQNLITMLQIWFC